MKILDIRIDSYTKDDLRSKIAELLRGDRKIKISKINPEFLYRASSDTGFAEVLNESDINIVDGRGVLWAARYLTLPITSNRFWRPLQSRLQMIASGAKIIFDPKFITYPIPEAIPGIEAFKTMLQAAIDANSSVFLFGSSQQTLDLACNEIKQQFPDLKIAGSLNGYDFQKDSTINPVDEINKTDARLLVVALGCPRQEHWISENIDKLKNIRVAVGEGGTLDRIANPSQKSPRFVNKIGLEWLWRLLFNRSKTESRNRFQRFWNSVPVFIHRIVKWKVKNGQAEV